MASVQDSFFMNTSSEEWIDFDQFLDLGPTYGDDHSASATSVSPDMSLSYGADMFGSDLPDLGDSPFPDMANYPIPQQSFLADQSPNVGIMPEPTQGFDNAGFYGYDSTYDFREMVQAQAAADSRVASMKEKRREAAIALHLQRLCDATALDLDMSSDSNTSFSSPSWSEYRRDSISPQPSSSSPEQAPMAMPCGNSAMEMVLDLNMNATTNLPKKQKPRSQAQKENYIKARKFGACEKHKKQHKRCNCLEKAAARAGVAEVPQTPAFRERPQLPVSPSIGVASMHSPTVPSHESMVSVPRPSVSLVKRPTSSSPEHDTKLVVNRQPLGLNKRSTGGSLGHNSLNLQTVSQKAAKVHTSAVRGNVRTDLSTPSTDAQQYSSANTNVRIRVEREQQSRMKMLCSRAFQDTKSSPGQDPVAAGRSVSGQRHVVAPLSEAPRWRHRTLNSMAGTSASGIAAQNVCPVSDNSVRQTIPSANSPALSSGALQVRRPRFTHSSTPVHTRPSATMAEREASRSASKQSLDLLAKTTTLEASPMGGMWSTVLGTPRERFQDPRDQRSVYVSTVGQASAICEKVGSNGSNLRSVVSRVREMFCGALVTASGLFQRYDLATGAESVLFKCLAFAGKQMMSVRRLQKSSLTGSTCQLDLL